MAESRAKKISTIQALAEHQNQYLTKHLKAIEFMAFKKVWEKEGRLNLNDFLTITAKNLCIKIEVDEDYLAEVLTLDGCYAIKTDLPVVVSRQTVHDRYKDLARVEVAFRTCKITHLELRPIFVCKETRTRGHVFIVFWPYCFNCS